MTMFRNRLRLLALTTVLGLPIAVPSGAQAESQVFWLHSSGLFNVWTIEHDQQPVGRNVPDALSNPGAWRHVGVGDIDGDGQAELVMQHTGSGQTKSFDIAGKTLQDGKAIFTPVTNDWRPVGLGDMNGDGTDDIIWQNDDGRVLYWKMQKGQRASSHHIATDKQVAGWTPVGAGDVDGDGRDDLVWQTKDGSHGAVHYWRIRQGLRASTGAIGEFASDHWRPAGLTDLDGDGTDDLIWQNTSSKQVWQWLLEKGTVKRKEYLYVADANWRSLGAHTKQAARATLQKAEHWVVTDVFISGSPAKPGPGYIALSENGIADPAFPNAAPMNVTKGIGGRNVWLYAKFEKYTAGAKTNPKRVLTDIQVSNWQKWGNVPSGYQAATTSGAGIPAGALSPATDGDCHRMGLAVKYANAADLAKQTSSQYIRRLKLSVTKNTAPQMPGSTWRRAGPDIHQGCGDSWAYNILAEYEKFDAPARQNSNDVSFARKQALMQQYLPQAFLWKDEQWKPSTVDYLLANTNAISIQNNIWRTTKQHLASSSSTLPFFHGQSYRQDRVYAFWIDKFYGPEIVYFYFYPYNRGKKVLGTLWGNHVGDWEHVTVRLDWNLNPHEVFAASHDKGQLKSWNSVEKFQGTHPVVYVASGSHGMYFDSGNHTYKSLAGGLIKLKDNRPDKARADAFFNPDTLAMFDVATKKDIKSGATWPDWINIFRWGNRERDCGRVTIFGKTIDLGVCQLEDGPTGPMFKTFMQSYWNREG